MFQEVEIVSIKVGLLLYRMLMNSVTMILNTFIPVWNKFLSIIVPYHVRYIVSSFLSCS